MHTLTVLPTSFTTPLPPSATQPNRTNNKQPVLTCAHLYVGPQAS